MTNPHRWWKPAGDAGEPRRTAGLIPEVGSLIAVIPTRQAWRVVRVDEVNVANWAHETLGFWEQHGSPNPETWAGRERRIMCEPPRNPAPNGKDRKGIRLSPWWDGEQWRPLSDPYPACIDCGLLWPCPCDDRNKEAAKAMAEVDRLGQILPGCCWACNEPITGRHHSIVFDGDNLLLPGGGPVAFHTSYSRKPEKWGRDKGTCRQQAEAYEERWVFAGEGRKVRLRCAGIEFRHYGAVVECTTGDDCPGSVATHSRYEHCTAQVFRNGVNYRPGEEFDPDEIRPRKNCGGKGCRGPKPAVAAADAILADPPA